MPIDAKMPNEKEHGNHDLEIARAEQRNRADCNRLQQVTQLINTSQPLNLSTSPKVKSTYTMAKVKKYPLPAPLVLLDNCEYLEYLSRSSKPFKPYKCIHSRCAVRHT